MYWYLATLRHGICYTGARKYLSSWPVEWLVGCGVGWMEPFLLTFIAFPKPIAGCFSLLDESAVATGRSIQYPPMLASMVWDTEWAVLRRCSVFWASPSVVRGKHSPWKKWRKPCSRCLRSTEAALGERVKGRERSGQVEASEGATLGSNVYWKIFFLWVLCSFTAP